MDSRSVFIVISVFFTFLCFIKCDPRLNPLANFDYTDGKWLQLEPEDSYINGTKLISKTDREKHAIWVFNSSWSLQNNYIEDDKRKSFYAEFVFDYLEKNSKALVGVTTFNNFKEGPDMLGIFYSLNGDILASQDEIEYKRFGPPIKEKLSIGVYVNYLKKSTVVGFYYDQVFLANVLILEEKAVEQLYPVIILNSNTSLVLSELSAKPPSTLNEFNSGKNDDIRKKLMSYNDAKNDKNVILISNETSPWLVGHWWLDLNSVVCEDDLDYTFVPLNDTTRPDVIELDGVALSIELSQVDPSINYFTFKPHILNLIDLKLAHSPYTDEWKADGPASSTNVRGSDGATAVENWIITFLHPPEKVQLLSVTGPLRIFNDDCYIVFNRAYPEPSTESPFNI